MDAIIIHVKLPDLLTIQNFIEQTNANITVQQVRDYYIWKEVYGHREVVYDFLVNRGIRIDNSINDGGSSRNFFQLVANQTGADMQEARQLADGLAVFTVDPNLQRRFTGGRATKWRAGEPITQEMLDDILNLRDIGAIGDFGITEFSPEILAFLGIK